MCQNAHSLHCIRLRLDHDGERSAYLPAKTHCRCACGSTGCREAGCRDPFPHAFAEAGELSFTLDLRWRGPGMKTLEFFFDCSSPWTYLAFTRVHDIARRTGTTIAWRPILVGGVFNAVNQSVYDRRAKPEPRQAPAASRAPALSPAPYAAPQPRQATAGRYQGKDPSVGASGRPLTGQERDQGCSSFGAVMSGVCP